ncbi:hypothetical protein WDU94_007432 [Cyamophila willieti]
MLEQRKEDPRIFNEVPTENSENNHAANNISEVNNSVGIDYAEISECNNLEDISAAHPTDSLNEGDSESSASDGDGSSVYSLLSMDELEDMIMDVPEDIIMDEGDIDESSASESEVYPSVDMDLWNYDFLNYSKLFCPRIARVILERYFTKPRDQRGTFKIHEARKRKPLQSRTGW